MSSKIFSCECMRGRIGFTCTRCRKGGAYLALLSICMYSDMLYLLWTKSFGMVFLIFDSRLLLLHISWRSGNGWSQSARISVLHRKWNIRLRVVFDLQPQWAQPTRQMDALQISVHSFSPRKKSWLRSGSCLQTSFQRELLRPLQVPVFHLAHCRKRQHPHRR